MAVSGSNRVKRGGNWNNNARNCRSANRNNNNPDNRNNNIGFRLLSTIRRRKVWFTDRNCARKALSRPSSRPAGFCGQTGHGVPAFGSLKKGEDRWVLSFPGSALECIRRGSAVAIVSRPCPG